LGGLFFCDAPAFDPSVLERSRARIAEIVAAAMPLFAILFVPLLFGIEHLYHWMDSEAVAGDKILHAKAPY
jgi:hypothetical protein